MYIVSQALAQSTGDQHKAQVGNVGQTQRLFLVKIRRAW
jgi:hypothetical protein